ncbi:MAG: helix-turn-helix domain-containing protein [Bacillota bacterium]
MTKEMGDKPADGADSGQVEEQRSHDADMAKVVGMRLRRLRERRGWTLVDVYRYTGIAAATLSEYETGHMDVPADRLADLAKLYAVSADWLLTGRDVAEQVRRKWPEGFAVFTEGSRSLNEEERGVFLHLANYLLKNEALLQRGQLQKVMRAFDEALRPAKPRGSTDEADEEKKP